MAMTDKIRELREAKGWSQEVMAEKMGIATSNYARLERGEVKLDWDKLQQIANIYKIDLVQLVEAENKGLVIQQTLSFQSDIQDNNKNYSSMPEELVFEIEKLKLIIQHKDELLAQKDRELTAKEKIIELLQK